jgi:esterase FrsA
MKKIGAFAAALFFATAAFAQDGTLKPRTWPELKAETLARAERSAYPVFHLDMKDVREALDKIQSLDPDEWGAAWMSVGEAHLSAANARLASDTAGARAEYIAAWRLFALGGWPVATSPKKAESRAKAWKAFDAYGRLAQPQIESVAIPFEGKEIKFTLQRPPGVSHPPVVIGIAGSDLWRDYAAIAMKPFVASGIAVITADMPGTGDSPVIGRPGSERVYSRIIDYVKAQSDLDGNRIIVRGESWGSYWAARVGYAEAARLKGIVFQSGPVDGYFQKKWQETAFKTREFLFDYAQSRLHMLGVSSVDEAYDVMPSLSLMKDGLIDKPTPPMLLIGGFRDSQVPFADLELLLQHGSPKHAWINPTGMTMGRSVTVKDDWILEHVILPWVRQQFATAD